MRVLLLGGTGAMGTYLTQHLHQAGVSVTVTSRTQRTSSEGVHYLCGNAKDLSFLNSILADQWDAIIDFMVYATDDFRCRIHQLLSATKQYIYLSSARVYADSSEPITESSPRLLDVSTDSDYLNSDEYALAKARQEDVLRDSGKANWTIIRPYITYGTDRLQLGVLEKEAWLYRAFHGRTVVFSEDMLSCKTTMTHGNDVARAIARLIGESAARGEAFHITGESSHTWESILEVYERALVESGLKIKVKNLDLDSFTRCHNGQYQIIYDRLYNRVFDNQKINEFIDTAEFYSIEEGLYQSAIDFLSNPRFRAIDWTHEGVKDKVTGELTNLKEINSLKDILKYLKYRIIK